MKININKNTKFSLNLNPGDIFEYENQIYMVSALKEWRFEPEQETYAAINLADGSYIWIDFHNTVIYYPNATINLS